MTIQYFPTLDNEQWSKSSCIGILTVWHAGLCRSKLRVYTLHADAQGVKAFCSEFIWHVHYRPYTYANSNDSSDNFILKPLKCVD